MAIQLSLSKKAMECFSKLSLKEQTEFKNIINNFAEQYLTNTKGINETEKIVDAILQTEEWKMM
jgi:hypothetical protein